MKSTANALNRRPGGPESRSGHFGEQINFLPLRGFQLGIVQLLAQSLYSLQYPGFLTNIKKKFHVRALHLISTVFHMSFIIFIGKQYLRNSVNFSSSSL
uniref:Uncharacterized protein n=1 Tax=Coptotermes formosanus TaxID=36987 RepID=R4V503_COPFO|nr:hypothetical protein [Coptotermes formosanus]